MPTVPPHLMGAVEQSFTIERGLRTMTVSCPKEIGNDN